MNKNTQNLLKLQIFLKYLYMCVYICSIYIYIYIYIYMLTFMWAIVHNHL